MLLVSVSCIVVHNTSELLQLEAIKPIFRMKMLVLVMLVPISIPTFVGGDYFCESGVNSGSTGGFHPNDPLWDGEGCSSSSSCCSFNNAPYFTKILPSPTSDPIEARLCQLDGGGDDSPVEFLELLYIK